MLRKGILTVAGVAALAVAGTAAASPDHEGRYGSGDFRFDPLAASATCTAAGGDPVAPLVLPEGFSQEIVAAEPGFQDLPDMNTLNESGPDQGRYLYRTHEVGADGSVSVTDLETGQTSVLAQDPSFSRLDGIEWTSWRTILAGEETTGGNVIEIDPSTGQWTRRLALGAMAHEGIQATSSGVVYVIDENSSGSIYRFVPDHPRDLSSGQLYALRLTADPGTKTGPAEWVPLDPAAVQIDARAAADAVGATGYGRPEDLELRGDMLYVAITSENRVLAIDLGGRRGSPFVSEYVGPNAGNAPADFSSPDNLVTDDRGGLYITEDPGGNFPAKTTGDDIWYATNGHRGRPAGEVVRFATLNDCDAEPTGIYFDRSGKTFYVNVQHRGGDGLDYAMAVTRDDERSDDDH